MAQIETTLTAIDKEKNDKNILDFYLVSSVFNNYLQRLFYGDAKKEFLTFSGNLKDFTNHYWFKEIVVKSGALEVTRGVNLEFASKELIEALFNYDGVPTIQNLEDLLLALFGTEEADIEITQVAPGHLLLSVVLIPDNPIVTESGDFLVTESGDILVHGSSVFAVNPVLFENILKKATALGIKIQLSTEQ